MAYEEYFDLYLKAQENKEAPYYVVSFDTIDSKKLSNNKRQILQQNILRTVKEVYDKLLETERELNREVVIKDSRFTTPWSTITNHNGNNIDPSIFGDSFAFTVLRDTVSKEEIIEWVEECRRKYHMEESFHIAEGYYETNDYGEGGEKFYRGYCLQTLETLHKPRVKKEIQKVKRKIKRRNEANGINEGL